MEQTLLAVFLCAIFTSIFMACSVVKAITHKRLPPIPAKSASFVWYSYKLTIKNGPSRDTISSASIDIESSCCLKLIEGSLHRM